MNTSSTSLAAKPKFSPPSRVAELYPLAHDRAVHDTLRMLLTDERDGQGRRVLRVQPNAAERQMLDQRGRLLAEHLAPAKRGDAARAVNGLLLSFGSSRAAGEEEAAAVLTQYVKVLEGMPIWAIKRACGRFERGEVEPSEVQGKLDRAFAPSTAQLYAVVEKSVRDFHKERMDILDARRGVLEHKIGAEEAKRVAEKTTAWLKRDDPGARAMVEATDREKEEGKKRVALSMQEGNESLILREYARLGIEPVRMPDGRLVSPSLAKKNGGLPDGG